MATAAFGVEYIETRSEAAIGAHAVLDIVANAGDAFDAIVIAAFGDPGVKAAKEIALCPVVGISESAFATAGLIGGKFSIIAISANYRLVSVSVPWPMAPCIGSQVFIRCLHH